MKRFLFPLLLPLLFSSCYHYKVLQPISGAEGQPEMSYQFDIPSLTSVQNGVSVTAYLLHQGSRTQNLVLDMHNASDAAVTFKPIEIKAISYANSGKSEEAKVRTADEVIRKRRKNAIIATSALVVAATVAVVAESELSTHNHNYDENEEPDFTLFYALGLAALVGQTQQPIFQPLPAQLLRTHTLAPGAHVRGVVQIKNVKDFRSKFEIEIPIGGKTEVFTFDGTKLAKVK